MNKFKVGDRVKRIKDSWFGMDVGDIGTIVNIGGGSSIDLKEYGGGHSAKFFELVASGKPKNPTHIVIWDEEDEDPHKFFESEDKAKEFVKELSEKSDVIKDSIILVEVKSARKVNIQKSLRYSKHTI